MRLVRPGRRTMLLGAVLVVAAGLAYQDAQADLFFLDTPYFFYVGRQLFSAEWLDIYAEPSLQAGPLHILVFGLIGRTTLLLGINQSLTAALLIEMGFLASIVATARMMRTSLARWWVDAALVAVVVALAMPWTAFATGHFSDGIIALLWAASTHAARNGKPIRAGLLVAVAAGLLSWGLLGLVTLLMAPDVRQVVRSTGVALGGIAVLYGPFFLFGTVNTLSYGWRVLRADGLMAPFIEHGEPFGWDARLIQASLVLGAGVVVVWLMRRNDSPHAEWAVPLALIATRLWTDPVGFYYYGLPLQVITVVALYTLLPWTLEVRRLPLLAGLYLLLLPFPFLLAPVGLVVCGLAAREPGDSPPDPTEQPALPPVTTPV